MSRQTEAIYIPLSDGKKKCVIIGAVFLWFYHALFSVALAIILPPVMEYYGIMDLYAVLTAVGSLLAAVTILLGGKLGDRIGRRKFCLVAGGLRVIAMTCCAIPTNGTVFFLMLCLARALGGLTASLCSAMICDVTSREERPFWMGIYGGANGAAFLMGLAMTGVVVDHLGGFAAFAVYTPFGLAGLVMVWLAMPNKPAANPAPVDTRGMALMTVGLGALLSWFSLGGKFFERTSFTGIALLVAGVILMYFFFRVEKKVSDPVLDLNFFRAKPFILSFFACMMVAPMSNTFSTALTLFGRNTMGLSSAVCGTLAIPKNLMFALLPPILGAWIAKDHRRFRIGFFGAGIFLAAGCLFGASWNESTPLWLIYAGMLLPGVGTACQSVSIKPYLQVHAPQETVGAAMAAVTFSNNIGTVLFSVVYNVVYNPRYAAAMELGGGVHLAAAMGEIFDIMCYFATGCAVMIIVLALLLIPRDEGKTPAT